MILDIVKFPAESLRKKAVPVAEFNNETKKLIKDMIETLYDITGFGLAAPQVGKSLRLFIYDETAGREGKNPKALINPVIIEKCGEMVGEEGCLSVPGEFATVKRFAKFVVEGLDIDGKPVRIEAEGQLARIFQHEIDHLEGTLFIDKLPEFKRDTIKKRIKKRIAAGDY